MADQVRIVGLAGQEVLVSWSKSPDGETVVDLSPTPDGVPLSLTVPNLLAAIAKMSEASKATLMYRLG